MKVDDVAFKYILLHNKKKVNLIGKLMMWQMSYQRRVC